MSSVLLRGMSLVPARTALNRRTVGRPLAAFAALLVGWPLTDSGLAQTVPAPPAPLEQREDLDGPNADPAADRMDVPDVAAIAAAEKLARDVFPQEFAASKPEDQAASARKLLEQVDATASAPAGKYVLCRSARDLAIEAGQVELSLAAIDAMAERFRVDAPSLKTEALTKLAETATTGRRKVANAALDVAGELADDDRYEAAIQAAYVALGVARKLSDEKLAQRVIDRGKEITARRGQHSAVGAALKTLAGDPNDAAANLVAGQWFWFIKGDAERGLSYLSRGDDAVLSGPAASDVAGPMDPAAQIQVADLWWEAAQKQSEPQKATLLARAQFWYERAVPQLTGLTKAKAAKRIHELTTALAASEAPPHEASNSTKRPNTRGTRPARPSKNQAYIGMIGTYTNKDGRVPYFNLSVPNGKNVLTDDNKNAMRGKVDLEFSRVEYVGMVMFPRDDTYTFEVQGVLTLNGVKLFSTHESVKRSDLQVKKGLCQINLSNGNPGGTMPGTRVKIVETSTGEEVPIFITQATIDLVDSSRLMGQKPVEVSGWKKQPITVAK